MNSSLKLKLKYTFWVMFSIGLGIFLGFIGTQSAGYEKILPAGNEAATVIESLPQEEAPKHFYFVKDLNQKPKVSASAYLVGDLKTGEIILQQNQEKIFPIASVSKLMTALVAKELMNPENPEDKVLVSKKALATYGQNGNFQAGEKIKLSEMFYPLLLQSSNDAAEIIAEHFNRDTFIKKMNQEALKLELSSTTFMDPSGLSEKNQSTVLDIFKLVGYLNQKNSDLLQITTERKYSNEKHSWSSNNQFLRKEGYLGGKSGFTNPAKETVVSLFAVSLGELGSRSIAITLLQSKDRYKDVENILAYLKKNIYYGGEADANTAWVKEKASIPEIKDPDFVTLVLAGDIMLDRGVKNSVMKNFKGDYSALFEKLEILKKSDIVFANLEGPASEKGKDIGNLYSFRMDPSVIPTLKGAGISVLSVANNHAGDWGREAYVDTLSRLEENEIFYTGGGMYKGKAEQPVVIEKYGLKIGFLGFSDVGPNWLEVTEDKAGLLLASNPRFEEIIKNASNQVDHLIVSFHFGEEYQTKHNDRQELLAHKAIDSGAKVVIGHHPHVVQDIEIYSPKDCTQSSCMGFIAYSLGNFIFDQYFSENTMQGMLLELKLNKNGEISVVKNVLKLNRAFQPDKIIPGKEEKVKFEEVKTEDPLISQ